jgi:hypothetical protein
LRHDGCHVFSGDDSPGQGGGGAGPELVPESTTQNSVAAVFWLDAGLVAAEGDACRVSRR